MLNWLEAISQFVIDDGLSESEEAAPITSAPKLTCNDGVVFILILLRVGKK
jgi:hypothetical protein